jgi:DNA-binding NtrC family response regulator
MNKRTLVQHPLAWRQLQNILARLACYTNGQTISAANVRAELNRFRNLEADTLRLPDSCSILLAGEGLEDFSYRIRGSVIEAVKNRMNGNISQAAQRLKVNRSSLHEIIRKINNRAKSKIDGRNELAA